LLLIFFLTPKRMIVTFFKPAFSLPAALDISIPLSFPSDRTLAALMSYDSILIMCYEPWQTWRTGKFPLLFPPLPPTFFFYIFFSLRLVRGIMSGPLFSADLIARSAVFPTLFPANVSHLPDLHARRFPPGVRVLSLFFILCRSQIISSGVVKDFLSILLCGFGLN